MSDLIDISPADIGLHGYPEFRQAQLEAIQFALYSPKRFIGLALPTGSGKSLVGRALSMIMEARTVFCTSTKGLEDQYLGEFGWEAQTLKAMGVPLDTNLLVDIRGKANYSCREFPNRTCDNGPMAGCQHSGNHGCTYNEAHMQARQARAVVTNYAYWMAANKGGGLLMQGHPVQAGNEVGLLVLDEAHLAPDELSGHLSVKITRKECRAVLGSEPPDSEDPQAWKAYIKQEELGVKLRLSNLTIASKTNKGSAQDRYLSEFIELDNLWKRLMTVNKICHSGRPDSWVIERQDHYGISWQFDPVWPGAFAESALFCNVPKVILMSATLRPKTLALLGIPPSEYDFREWPKVFPKHRSPVIHIPTAQMNWRSNDAAWQAWMERIDEIIESRKGTKGIIHTVSYDRQQHILLRSKFKSLMIGNTGDKGTPKAAEIVEKFKAAPAPCILVSPSMSTGWDFPDDQCRWQIVTKVPYPNTKTQIMKKRIASDKQYADYMAAQELVQMCGRGARHEKDRCETFIVDDSITRLFWHNKDLFPKSFELQKMAHLPKLPPTT